MATLPLGLGHPLAKRACSMIQKIECTNLYHKCDGVGDASLIKWKSRPPITPFLD
jgi:hypothetical protein